MTDRTLEIRLEQFDDPIGHLTSTSDGNISFSYTEQYLARPDRAPLSLAFPLDTEEFGDRLTRAFFDNLLPENDQLNRVMEREGLARADVVGLLFHLGADCPGAISCIPAGEGAVKIPGVLPTDYDILQDREIGEIVRRLADRRPLPNEVRDPSPLAGVQRKIALTQFQDGRFGTPKRGLRVPTTHILKVPGRNNQREPRLEAAAALIAQAVGLKVAVPTVLGIEGLSALLVPRFDRRVGQDGAVRRVHQEDFAQALGLPAGLKYERHGREDRRFDIVAILRILELTAEPAISKRDFISATIFNMIVGNNDNHAKNHALLYDKGAIPRLAPLYDILPVRLDGGITHDFSFKIGAAERFDALTKSDLFSFFRTLGLSRAAVRRFVKDTIAPMIDQIDRSTANFAAQGLKDFDDLIGREAERLMEVLEIKVPIRPHDHYSPKGGGWSMGS